jgi:LmbE family N-acetylglucosaminyl deacetylase
LQEIPSEFARVLVVGAHPDDAEFFAGGTLAGFVARGAQVHLAVCTSGSKGGRGLPDANEVRQREQARAAAILGLANVTNFGLSDGELEITEELRKTLVQAIRQLRPEVVLGHDPRTLWTSVGDRVELGHTDHRAAGQALLDAVYPRSANPNFYPEIALEPWCPREVWLFDTASQDLVLDISDAWLKKLKALRAHVSQEAVAGGLTKPATELAREFRQGDRIGETLFPRRLADRR